MASEEGRVGTRGSAAAWAPGHVGAVLWGRTSVGSHANVPSSGSELNGTVRAPVRVRRVEDPAVGVGNPTGLMSEVSRVKAGLCSPCTCPSPPPGRGRVEEGRDPREPGPGLGPRWAPSPESDAQPQLWRPGRGAPAPCRRCGRTRGARPGCEPSHSPVAWWSLSFSHDLP